MLNQNFFQNIKSTYLRHLFAKKSASALLYLMFLPLCHTLNKDNHNRAKDLAYKSLDRLIPVGNWLLQRFVKAYFIPEFRAWLAKSPSTHSKKPLTLRIDSSKLKQHFGKNMPRLAKLFDPVSGSRIWTNAIYVINIGLGNKEFIPAFFLWNPENRKGNHKMATHLIEQWMEALPEDLRIPFYQHCRVSLDGAWGNGAMLAYFQQSSFRRVVMKAGGKDLVALTDAQPVSLKTFQKRLISQLNQGTKQWKCFSQKRGWKDVVYYEQLVTLANSDVTVHMVLLKYDGKKPRYLLLLSLPDVDWHAHQIVRAYKHRWTIEVMFRTSKQAFGLCDYQFHIKTDGETTEKTRQHLAFMRLEGQLALRLIAYMVVQWYRCDRTKFHTTPLKVVLERWRRYFDSLSQKQLQELFSS